MKTSEKREKEVTPISHLNFKVAKFNKVLMANGSYEEAIVYSNLLDSELELVLNYYNKDLDTYIDIQRKKGQAKLRLSLYNVAISNKQNSVTASKEFYDRYIKESDSNGAETKIVELPARDII